MLMLFVSFAAGAFGAMLHESAREVSLAAIGIISLCTLVSPLVGILSELDNPPRFSTSVSFPEGGISDAVEDSFLLGVECYILSEWEIPEENVRVSLDGFSAVDARAACLTVSLSGTGAFVDTRSMRDKLAELFVLPEGKCVVVIDFDQ